MDFKNIESSYNPIPLWMWNSKLNINSTASMAEKFAKSGFGGFCITPGSGLSARYLSEEWLRNISAALDCAADISAEGWICDRLQGFSGFAKSDIYSKGLKYQQKFLRFESGDKTNDRTIIYSDGYHFYYDVNPYDIDYFNSSAASEFVSKAYTPYKDKSISGILLNAPTFGEDNIPWSFSFPAEYKSMYGEELLDVLAELFRPVGNYQSTRRKFYGMVNKLYSENIVSVIYDLFSQSDVSIALSVDSADDYCQVPGSSYADLYCCQAPSPINVSRVDAITTSSAAKQNGKKAGAILYSACGHSRNFNELKNMAEQYLVRGITKIFPCHIPYSFDGFRKNTVSTPFILSEMTNAVNTKFCNAVSRISKVLSCGEECCDTLLIRNFTVSRAVLEETISILEKKHIPFDIVDETVIKECGYVEEGSLVIGKRRYKTIVLTESTEFLESTTRILTEFESRGGFITMASSLKENEICNNENLLYTARSFPDYKIHYFVNNSQEVFTASITAGNKLLDAVTGEISPFFGIYKFSPYESILVIDDGTMQSARPYSKPLKKLDISGMWDFESSTDNFFVLDKCDVIIDNEIMHTDIYAGDVTEILSANAKSCDAECVYKFSVTSLPNVLCVCISENSNHILKVNDTIIPLSEESYFREDIFCSVDITQYIVEGENKISVSSRFSAGEKFRLLRDKVSSSSTELDKLIYETEFPVLYLKGEFAVLTEGEFFRLDKRALRYVGSFSLSGLSEKCSVSNIEKCGFPFFSGEITLSKTFNLSDTSYMLEFLPKNLKNLTVEINGKIVDEIIWAPYECDISSYLQKGDNTIRLHMNCGLRNLFGPHHKPLGELLSVSFRDYYKQPSVWTENAQLPWEQNYCILETGIDNAQ